MEAKEMFEKSGYETRLEDTSTISYVNYNKNGNIIIIGFHVNRKLFHSTDRHINVEEHLAIHQQMKELGWIE